ncbi:TMhelix containing protein [Bacillus manliponensis]
MKGLVLAALTAAFGFVAYEKCLHVIEIVENLIS